MQKRIGAPAVALGLALGAMATLPVLSQTAFAQALDEENVIELTLTDGTTVRMVGEAAPLGSDLPSDEYYYLPTNLRLSRTPTGKPEFLFLKYTTEDTPDRGGIQGGLLHFLMEWGLTREQEEELEGELEERRPGATLAGAARVEPAGDNGSFRIISATLTSEGRTSALVMSGIAPVLPGAKVAVAADLDAYGAQLFDATLDPSQAISDLTVELNLAYTALVPAAKGRIVMDWQRLAQHYDSLKADYERTIGGQRRRCFIWCWRSSAYSYSYNEVRQQYDYLLDTNVIQLDFEERVEDERVARIRDAFFEYFLDHFTSPSNPLTGAPADEDEEEAEMPDIRKGARYEFQRVSQETMYQRGVQTFNLNYRLAFRRPITVTGNMMSWYDEVRGDPSLVVSRILNHPFYANYDVRFRVDFDAPRELFSSAINYVAVTMRKERAEGHDFEDAVTIDEEYIKDNGTVATMTYAHAGDPNPAEYDYKVQWSLKGGHVYPEQPRWISSDMPAVTLAPPVIPRTVELEGDLEELDASDIARVTAQLRFMQFGREAEENIQLPVRNGEPLVSGTVFFDRDARGYAYRLVIHHKREGRLATDWSAKVADDYIYALIPQELLEDEDLMDAAREAARETSENVLDQFRELFEGGGQ
ncbi:MAG: hypothetical protein PVJ64_04110 [Gemmatimonadales bacterium]|jgi:hypothetical protein